MESKIDWSQFEVKDNDHKSTDWSQYESEDNNESKLAATPFNDRMPAESDEGIPIPETTGLSGIASDLFSSALSAKDFAQDIPNKVEDLGEELLQHPGTGSLRGLGQLGAGTADFAKDFVNSPYNLNQYLARKHLLPQVLGKLGKLIPHIPEDTGVEKTLGLEPRKGDELLRALPQIAGAAKTGKSLYSAGKKLVTPPDLKKVLKETQSKVNTATKNSGKIFDQIEQTLDEHGKNIVPVDQDLIVQAKTMLSNKFNNIIEKAKGGEYKALRKLQSALGAKERKGLSSNNLGDIDQAENIGVVRNDINEAIQKHLENTGFKDLAKALEQNKKDYRNIKETYFSNPALAKVFGKSQKVPKNPMTLLTEDSVEMNKFMSAHPEVKQALSKALKHENKMKNLKKISAIIGAGTSAELTREALGGK